MKPDKKTLAPVNHMRSEIRRSPVAPPVYRPQPTPKVLQTKRITPAGATTTPLASVPRVAQCAKRRTVKKKRDPNSPGERLHHKDQKLLLSSQLVFESEVAEMDYGDIAGMNRFRSDVSSVQPDDNFYSNFGGYAYQFDQTKALHKRGKVQGVEVEYQGASGTYRRVDVETMTNKYIEFKAYSTDYDPASQVKAAFRRQAQDYAHSGKTVKYCFSNDPPQWAKDILQGLNLPWKVR
jgi:hypothetical protein